MFGINDAIAAISNLADDANKRICQDATEGLDHPGLRTVDKIKGVAKK